MKKGTGMKLQVNGKELFFENPITINALIKSLNIEGKVMATAVNMEIIKEQEWGYFMPKDGDKIEMLDFVGGG